MIRIRYIYTYVRQLITSRLHINQLPPATESQPTATLYFGWAARIATGCERPVLPSKRVPQHRTNAFAATHAFVAPPADCAVWATRNVTPHLCFACSALDHIRHFCPILFISWATYLSLRSFMNQGGQRDDLHSVCNCLLGLVVLFSVDRYRCCQRTPDDVDRG